MAQFETWERETINQFAREASENLLRAHAEVARLKKAMEEWRDIAVLRERDMDELRRDANRYRWLQEKIKPSYGMWFIDARLGREGPTEIGAAIDYAMRNGA